MAEAITTPAAGAIDRSRYLEVSPNESDGGNDIGRDPRQVPLTELRLLKHPESPIKAIRAFCVDCSGGNSAEARKCVAVKCHLWPMRMGVSPFHARSASSLLERGSKPSFQEEEGI